MDNIYIQYIFIAFLLGFAIWYIYGMIRDTFKRNKTGGCSKNCGCESSKIKKEK